jgi:nucleoside-diphosphate-sugar epimerase
MKTALVCGAGGFIGVHLVRLLKRSGYWVRGVDIKRPEFSDSDADEFLLLDLRNPDDCHRAVDLGSGTPFDEVYQLAADMGGMGFIHSAECEIMTNSALINIHMINAACDARVGRYLFASSACVYRDQEIGEDEICEDDAYPARPDNEYGWEKLYAERMAFAHSRNRGLPVRVARFQNCYGPEGTWEGGREKAPAALCRKIAEASDGDVIEVWGDGSAIRVYTYVSDLCSGIVELMQSNITEPTNIGSSELVSVDELVETIAEVSGKSIGIRHIDGPVGVQARYHSVARIERTGWRARVDLRRGIEATYAWVERQVKERGSSRISG